MTALPKRQTYTPEEYLALEEKAEYRSEYVDGYIFKLAGAAEAHQDITLNIASQFEEKLRGRCKAYASEMKVWIDAAGTFFIPMLPLFAASGNFVTETLASLKIRFYWSKFYQEARKIMIKTISFLLIKASNRFRNTF